MVPSPHWDQSQTVTEQKPQQKISVERERERERERDSNLKEWVMWVRLKLERNVYIYEFRLEFGGKEYCWRGMEVFWGGGGGGSYLTWRFHFHCHEGGLRYAFLQVIMKVWLIYIYIYITIIIIILVLWFCFFITALTNTLCPSFFGITISIKFYLVMSSLLLNQQPLCQRKQYFTLFRLVRLRLIAIAGTHYKLKCPVRSSPNPFLT